MIDQEKLRAALRHLGAHENLDAFAASQSEKIGIVRIASREGLLAVDRAKWGYRLTSRGRGYCGNRTWARGRLVACVAGAAALAALGYAAAELGPGRIASAPAPKPEPAVASTSMSPMASEPAPVDVIAAAPLPAAETTGTAAGPDPAVAQMREAARKSEPTKKVAKRRHATSRPKIAVPANPSGWHQWTEFRAPTLF